MSGIPRDLQPDPKHIAKHLPNTPQMQKLLRDEGAVHLFHDEETLQTVAQTIIEQGEFIGTIRGHDGQRPTGGHRYGLYFPQPIGYRMNEDGDRLALYYGEMKIKGDKYHVIPRTRPSR